MNLFRPIHHTFAPLGDRRQRWLAFPLLFQPSTWQRGSATDELKLALAEKFAGEPYLFSGGRDALLAYLRAIKQTDEDEVIVQGYTCVVLPNAIHAAGMKTVYSDIEHNTLNFDMSQLEHCITPRTRAIIAQHTFGIPADAERLRSMCDAHGILLIEDCAHVIPDDEGPVNTGKLGDAVILSFGRDKAISGIAGGALMNRKNEYSNALRQMESDATDLPKSVIWRLLMYPFIYWKARPLYGLGIGKLYLAIVSKLGFLVPILTKSEKDGTAPSLAHMPNACAILALDQLKRLRSINDHRRMLTALYIHECTAAHIPLLRSIQPDLPLQKFPLFLRGAPSIRRQLKSKNIHLDDGWTGCVVCPANVNIEETGYEKGQDPEAEKLCEGIVSLPTHPGTSQADAKKLVSLLSTLVRSAS